MNVLSIRRVKRGLIVYTYLVLNTLERVCVLFRFHAKIDRIKFARFLIFFDLFHSSILLENIHFYEPEMGELEI